jgi:D-xylose 1-dehydrogenase (NADP+, D-xylono-1,5-lactone-forming)
MNQSTIRWGILSTAHINRVIIKALAMSPRNRLLVVASRSGEKADRYAREWKIPRSHGSYEALLADPEIDVIYNPLPNHLHAEWTIKAVEAGKHVLCEKPLALSLAEVDAITAAARAHGRVVAEAFMYRTYPLALKVKQIVDSGALGKIKLVRGSFTYKNDGNDNYRLHPDYGGGAMWDIGCYPLSYARFILGVEPEQVFGWQVTGQTGIDESFVAQMQFPGGAFAQFDCSFAIPYHVFIEIVGSDASLRVTDPFIPKPRVDIIITNEAGHMRRIAFKGSGTYLDEVEDMADAILHGKPNRISLADSRANVATILALLESARSGRPVQPAS